MPARSSPPVRLRSWNRVARACGVLVAAYWALAAAVIATDPFDIYPWGPPPLVDPDDVTDDNRQAIVATLKNPQVDLVMVGASTSIAYSPDDLRRAFPASRHPVNLSYGGVRPGDRAAVLDQVIRRSRARRVVIWLDWSYILPPEEQVGAFPGYLYNDTVLDDPKMVNLDALRIVADRWRTRPMFPHFRSDLALIERSYTGEYDAFHAPHSLAALDGAAVRFRDVVLRPSGKRCADLAAMQRQLLPQLRALLGQGRQVDVVVPPYSPGFYYARAAAGDETMFGDQLLLRRCLVKATAGWQGLAIQALDADRGLTGTLTNYKDTNHLFGSAALTRAIDGVANAAYRLDRRNLDGYLTGLRHDVATFRVGIRNRERRGG